MANQYLKNSQENTGTLHCIARKQKIASHTGIAQKLKKQQIQKKLQKGKLSFW